MAKPDWGVLQQRFLSDHAVTGVSPKEWCEAQGLNYATARRHIKKPSAQTAQKAAQKKVRTAQKEKCADELVEDDDLTAQQRLFVAEYLKDRNATQAAIRAGYSKKTANEQGARLLAKVSVAQAIAQQQKASIERTLGSADEVLSQMWQLATFDANQLSQYRRGACRYCWGFGHHYQWRDAVEFDEALAKVEGKEGVKLPEDPGGYGYDHNREPNPGCPRCNGDGIGQPYFADIRIPRCCMCRSTQNPSTTSRRYPASRKGVLSASRRTMIRLAGFITAPGTGHSNGAGRITLRGSGSMYSRSRALAWVVG